LQPNIRADIRRATEAFLFSQNFERTDEAIAKVKVILEGHDKAATRFFNELFGGASSLSDAGVYAHHLIDNNFKPARLRSDKADLDVFLDFLRAFHIACNTAMKQLTDPSFDRRVSPWKIWLNRLAEIVEQDLHGESASTIPSFSSSVNCKNAFPLNANATKRQSQKLSSKRDQNPENSRGVKGKEGDDGRADRTTNCGAGNSRTWSTAPHAGGAWCRSCSLSNDRHPRCAGSRAHKRMARPLLETDV
jgi:hypothetical protein